VASRAFWHCQAFAAFAYPAVDAVYFSGAVYTSLGFGDIVPTGPGRMLAVSESVVGLVLIAWTASFTYFLMQKYWEEESA
jgi:hypothetical protein